MSAHGYNFPATAICPGCGTMVTLPPEPLFPDSPPAICATCDTEVPDYRRASFSPSSETNLIRRPHPAMEQPKEPSVPIEERKISRGNLFRSLGGLIADRAENAVESAKDKFSND